MTSKANHSLQAAIKLTQNSLNKLGHQRANTEYISQMFEQPSSRFVLFSSDGFACEHEQVMLLDKNQLITMGFAQYLEDHSQWRYIGQYELAEQQAIFSLEMSSETIIQQLQWLKLRELGLIHDNLLGNLLATAQGLHLWHKSHQYCHQCGSQTESIHAGHARECLADDCQSQMFPRIDPAMIVLVTYQEQCLIARAHSWPEKRFSCLAGFVETGESIEAAVHREVFEEVGLTLSSVDYQASQPWPFPRSLMLGFYAEAEHQQLAFHDDEIAEAKWFTAKQMQQAVVEQQLLLSNELSISHHLIHHWYQQQTGEPLVHPNQP
jgi:NAD+ diphosphatase